MTRFGFVRAALARQPSWPFGLLVTFTALAAASGLRALLGIAADPVPFITFFPAVLLCALFAGWRWGMVCALVATIEVNVLFRSPSLTLSLDRPSMVISLLFVTASALMVAVAETLRRTFRAVGEANARTELLNAELRHRVRNLLALVQAIAGQTASGDPAEFKRKFTARLIALARAQDMLAGSAEGICRLDTIVAESCKAFHSGRNLEFSGPPCTVPEKSCIPLTLVLHELCTNATKHGALSVPGGRVTIAWQFQEADVVRLDWIESGGPPVKPPTRQGFGTKLLRAQPGLLTVEQDYAPDGLRCRLTMAGARPAAESGAGHLRAVAA